MTGKNKKPRAAILWTAIGTVLSVALIVGTVIAYKYETVLDVFFTSSSYSAGDAEKDLCRNVAEEGAVLLKNADGALPLKEAERKVALFGQDSVDFVYGGSGSGSVDVDQAPNAKQAFESEGFTVNQTLWDFYQSGPGKNYRKATPDVQGRGSFAVNEVPADVYTEAVKNSLTDDVAIAFIGRSGGESSDLPTEALPTGYRYLQIDGDERAMLQLACAKYSKVILVYNGNNPLELGFLEQPEYANVKAALWIGGVGQEGLYAIPRILKGTINPSGRLVDTYAYDSTSAPSFQNFGNYTIANSNVARGDKYLVYGEGIYVGYRYYETRYEDVILGNANLFDYASAVQFPFGYGLSYTTFEWSDYLVQEESDHYAVSVSVKNTGETAGKDVVEIYLQKPYVAGGVEVASVELVGFGKTNLLGKGESQTITVTVDKSLFASYDYQDHKTYILNPGDYYLSAGRDAHDALNNILSRKGKTTADGMTASGNPALASVAKTQASLDATAFSKTAEGASITNRLDSVDINTYEAYDYLSRADWEGTFPTTFHAGSWNAGDDVLADLGFYDVNLDHEDDAAIASFVFKTNSTSTSLKVTDLVDAAYDDPRWDDIIDQLSYNQMTKLIRMGGYSTASVDRIALPATQDKDGPSGISGTLVGGTSAMAWPAEVVMAATMNVELIEKLGEMFGNDSIQIGVAGVYGPGANIHRSPYSGRNFEYFSEDATLSYQMAAHELRGLRSKGVITYAKHFALNDEETNRTGGALFANEQAIRELYLKGFEGAVKEGHTNGLMAAMNRIGTRWAGAHRGLMSDILRTEWGFEGMVITDQASVPAMFYQDHISGLWAGTDMWLNTSSDYWSLEAYAEDKTMQYYIHRAAKNIVYSVTKSWAVDERFRTSGGQTAQTNAFTFPWRPVLIAGDSVVFAATIIGAGVLWFLYIRGKKRNIEIQD